jgi:hypothetical protein
MRSSSAPDASWPAAPAAEILAQTAAPLPLLGASSAPATPPAEQEPPPPLGERAAKSDGRRASNTRTGHLTVHELLSQGMALKAIGRRLQMNVKTVRKYARAEHPEHLIAPNPPPGRDVPGAFKLYLQTRIEQEPETDNQLL